MKPTTIYVGMDVHKESILLGELRGRRRSVEPIVQMPHDLTRLRRRFGRLKAEGHRILACYEAGSCGFEIHRMLREMDIECQVVAPSLIPVRAGDRVKTDRRDAEKLARLLRAGELTAIRVPTEEEEALRDLVRAREDLREDVTRERHRLLKFLLRHGRRYSEGSHWTLRHWAWIRRQHFDEPHAQTVAEEYTERLELTLERRRVIDQAIDEAARHPAVRDLVGRLRCLRGIDTLSAVALVAEIVDFRRFASAAEFMAYVGLVPSERSSGGQRRRGGITKTGNSHVRRLLIEAAWHYRHPPRRSATMRARWEGQPPEVVAHAWKAQQRLHRRFARFVHRGMRSQVAVTAVARELAGFVWAVATAEASPVPARAHEAIA